jgi:hypothetical protein
MSYTPGVGVNYTWELIVFSVCCFCVFLFSTLCTQFRYSTDDHETARKNLIFLLQWYIKFPQFQHHKLIISGESYAGTYIPTFTVEILKYNQRSRSNPVPLVGLMIGNPCKKKKHTHREIVVLTALFRHGGAHRSSWCEQFNCFCVSNQKTTSAFFKLASTHNLIPPSLSAAIIATCPEAFPYIPDNTCCQFNYSAYPAQSQQCVANLNQWRTTK